MEFNCIRTDFDFVPLCLKLKVIKLGLEILRFSINDTSKFRDRYFKVLFSLS
jgi:hypothetical protein